MDRVEARQREPDSRSPAEVDTAELLILAVEAARRAGELLEERFRSGRAGSVSSKSSPTDLVSEADLAAERAIHELLEERRPEDGMLAEEGGERQGRSGLRWVVDPLDGTINFLFGIPHWCVSVAVEDHSGALAGAIFDPNRDELFTAERDGRALLNGSELLTRTGVEVPAVLMATGLSYEAQVRAAQGRVLERVIPRVRDLRRMGSAALDLAWTAAGRFDAYFERCMNPWDIAAGTLICERAGLLVTELPVHVDLPFGILASPPHLAAELLELVGGPGQPH